MRLLDGLTPEQICFISFTRKAANEARERVIEQLKVDEERITWFRTLHSLAFQQCGLNKTDVMSLPDYIKICEMLGISISYRAVNSDDGSFNGQTLGDRYFFAENMARARMISLHEYWESIPDEDMHYQGLKQLSDTLANYKRTFKKLDFTDVIYRFIETGIVPPCQVLIVDEAQDLSPLQWRMVQKMAAEIPEVFIAGDDDQAIFRWAGADVDHLIKMPGRQEVLQQSFRVPRAVQVIANTIAQRIQTRVKKDWHARDCEGAVERVNDLSHIDMSRGTWLLLARNGYLLDQYVDQCVREGFMFDTNRESPVSKDSYLAIRDWKVLMTGAQIPAIAVKRIYDCMSARTAVVHGFKKVVAALPDRKLLTLVELYKDYGLIAKGDWDEVLDKINQVERQYFRLSFKTEGPQDAGPRIRISTIHGAKGGEADNVVLFTDMAYRTWREFQKMPDDEHRVWYVAVTRTRETLHLITPQTKMCYDI